MYCITVEHEPRQRNKFPHNWTVVSPTKVAHLCKDGEYWFGQLQTKPWVKKIDLMNLNDGSIRHAFGKG